MSRCELSGKGPVVKNLVSHSNIKTKFKAQPNVQYKQLFSNTLNRSVRLQIATSTIRSLEHNGGFDTYILNQPDKQLSKRALTVKTKIKQALSRKTPRKAKTEKKGASK
jgi:large subunit ribosomal protein L28